MCLAGHEAMAMGLPILATPVGELAFSVISGQTGFSLSGNLENSLCDALNTLFAHPSLCNATAAMRVSLYKQSLANKRLMPQGLVL